VADNGRLDSEQAQAGLISPATGRVEIVECGAVCPELKVVEVDDNFVSAERCFCRQVFIFLHEYTTFFYSGAKAIRTEFPEHVALPFFT
jgi:hypothetical protein